MTSKRTRTALFAALAAGLLLAGVVGAIYFGKDVRNNEQDEEEVAEEQPPPVPILKPPAIKAPVIKAPAPKVPAVPAPKISKADLESLYRRRKLASDFIRSMVVIPSHPEAIKELLDGDLKAEAPALKGAKEIAESARQRHYSTIPDLPRNVFGRGGTPQDLEREAKRIVGGIREDLAFLRFLARRDELKGKPAQLRIVQTLATVLGYQLWEVGHYYQSADRAELYFGGSRKTDTLLDFLVWKEQADKFGINLTDADVRRALQREAGNRDVFEKGQPFEKSAQVRAFLRLTRGLEEDLTGADLLNALRDEFRVTLAQAIVLGHEPGVRAYRSILGANRVPSPATPDEYLKWYRDKRTTLRVKFMALPVEKFIDTPAVQALKPSEAALRKLFREYEDWEPADKREPGFKTPQRIAIEYIVARPDDPYYKELARQNLALFARQTIGAASGVGSLGTGLIGQPAALAGTLMQGPLAAEHKAYQKDNHYWLHADDKPFEALNEGGRRLPDRGTFQPATVCETLGALLGNAALRGTALAAPSACYAAGARGQSRDCAGLAVLLLGRALPAPPGAPVLAGPAALVAPYKSEALTFEEAKPILLAQLERRYAEALLRQNLIAMQLKLFDKRGKPEEQKPYVERACKDFHLARHSMPRAHTFEEVVNDLQAGKNELNLKRLFDEAQSRPFFDPEISRERTFTARSFADRLFDRRMGLYVLMSLPGAVPYSGEEVFFWRSEDIPPTRSPNYEAVREKVKRAWHFDKAREVTRARAAEIVKQIKGPAAAHRLADVQAKGQNRYGSIFELEGLAKLWRPEREPLRTGLYEYRPYRVSEDMIDLFLYPPPDMVSQLMALKKRGDAMVIADAPARTFYVAVLEARDDRQNFEAFLAVFKDPAHAQFWRLFDEERAEEHRQKVLEQLRRESTIYRRFER